MNEIIREYDGYKINVRWIMMGKDLCVTITGGDLEHLGAVAVGVPRPSLSDSKKISSSVSVITLTGHKEDVMVRDAAAYLASKLNVNVVVSAGIHIDGIAEDTICNIGSEVVKLMNDLADSFV